MRVDFAGGWSDVPTFAAREGGAVVNGAIALFVHVECLMGDNRIRLRAEDLDAYVSIASPADLVYDGTLDLHKAALNMLPVTGGIEIITRSDAPGGSGLGASGALDVALLAGLARCREEDYPAEELAEMGFQLEAQELGLLGGRQDQFAAALGGFLDMKFGGEETAVRALAVSDDHVRDLERHVLIAYTGHSHFSSATHERVWQGYEREADVADALRTIRDLAEPAARALEGARWRELARLVSENWAQQQRLDATISTPRVQGIERAALDAGAWGLKATGAGAGGCLIIMAPPDRCDAIVAAVTAAGGEVLDVGFAADGVTVEVEES
jgi:D-glycero-alpha-D-manno-heptose-7-phosphate kinase